MPNDTDRAPTHLYWIVLPGLAGLVAFYYLTRADTIGVLSKGAWTPMTQGPVPAWGHFTAAARGFVRKHLAPQLLGHD